MGKEVLTALIDENAKDGFTKAIEVARVDGTTFNSMRGLVEKIGFQLREQLEGHDGSPVELTVNLTPIVRGS